MLVKAVKRAVSFALPATCPVCQCLLPALEPAGVCVKCWKDLPFWKIEKVPAPHLPPEIDSFSAPFLYKEPVNKWILALKFGDKTELAPILGEFLLASVPKVANPLLVPVPLHVSRLRKRLFNQSSLLAKAVASKTGAELNNFALLRVRKTIPQVGKTKIQRQKMPLNTFKANQKIVQGRNVILIDDIYTTGTTAKVCAKVLKKAGAKRVDVVTIAYVEI